MLRFFERLVDPYRPYADQDAPPATLRGYLRDMLWPLRWSIGLALLVCLFNALAEVWLINYLGRLVDLLAATGPEQVWAAHGWEFLAAALFVLLLKPLSSIIGIAFLNQTMFPNLSALVRWRAHRHVLRQSVGWFQNDFAGRIANRIMQTPSAVAEVNFQIIDAFAFAAIYMVSAVVLFGTADPRLLLPLGLWLAAYVGIVVYFVPRVGRAARVFSEARSAITGRIVDSYTNIASVKLFAHSQGEEDYAKDAIEEGRRTFQIQMRLITWMEGSLYVLNGALVVSVVGYALWLWSTGTASLGLVAAAGALVLRLAAMTGWIMWSASSTFQNLGVIREGLETIAQPLTLTDKPGAPALKVTAGEIAFDGVGHSYGKAAGGLEQVSLTIPAGQKVGLVGRSGAGKSTLVNLLLRFHDAEAGDIRIDGQSIYGVTQDSLRSAIGMVTQDSALLHRSVRDNIAYGRPDADLEAIARAAAQAEATEFIPGLADPKGREGYDAHVGERGVKLSGGQRQRIALARVILKDAPILVLDEATSALDSEVEAAIQRTLYGVMEGKTVIAIAHRLSTIAQLDRIVVLDQGRVVEDGPHAALLAQGGLYANFWTRQSGGFLDTRAAE